MNERIASFIVTIFLMLIGPVSAAEQRSQPIEPSGENGMCLDCHANAGYLMQAVHPPSAPSESSCAAAPARPPFLGSFVNPDFTGSLHGRIGCTGCHGGDAKTEDAARAHADMTPANVGCAACHQDIAARHATSLHATLDGMAHALKLRSGDENFHKLAPMWESDCASCHASCSDCHVTLPAAVGGGLIKGHEIFKRPPMKDTCAVCHGSRAGGEYLGAFAGVAPDVHFEAGMHCLDCHKNDLHGDGQSYTDRWQVTDKPACTDCHAPLPNATTRAHNAKHADVSCQVCHGQPYQSCFDCHSSEEDGRYVRSAGHKALDFKIGRNTAPGYPYGIVTLRNNPVARDSFAYLGHGLLPHFDNFPTWKTAAPHNVQRITDHARTCRDCHENAALYLRDADLDPQGAAANTKAVLEPKPMHKTIQNTPRK